MNFQEYCESVDGNQKIKSEKSFLLTYTNTKQEAFSISPDSIESFLVFLYENFEAVEERWKGVLSRKDYIFQYEEKSYREIYKSADLDSLKTISSSGRSQTKALTKLISKIIVFLLGEQYQGPEVNTFFSKSDIKRALDNWSRLFFDSNSSVSVEDSKKSKRESFRLWMINSGLSERTASSYSGAGINFCDRFLSDVGKDSKTLYELDSSQVSEILERLKNIEEWSNADKSGNSMYSAACKKLSKFLLFSERNALYPLAKPFLLLAGISGTGKTRFVRKQAERTGSLGDTYCLTAVRPDWHEPSDLLGYVSRLGDKPQYVATDVLRFIVKAWREIIESIERDGQGLPEDWRGRELEYIRPYWLCLDEMNLAPVEQYFADYLSILETRRWNDPEKLAETGLSYVYECDPLIKGTVLTSLDADISSGQEKPSSLLAKDLGFDFEKSLDSDIWDYFLIHGISIPFNLIVAGTVNMDETTHGFSRKVIDRAMSFDFGAFFPNNYDEFFSPTSRNKRLSYPTWSHACKTDLASTFDTDGSQTVSFLKAVNHVLKNTPFELAYRALNELLLSVVSSQPQDELTLKAVWDDFMMCKVLPRIEGDTDKLTTVDGKDILAELNAVLAEQLAPMWHADKNDEANLRPDLYREKVAEEGASDKEKLLRIPCRTKEKLAWMQQRLASATFTSFWP